MATAFAVATGGCGSESSVDAQALGTTRDPVVERRDLQVLGAAQAELTRRCMRDRGYDYHAPSVQELRQEGLNNAPAPFGFWSRDDVARWVRSAGRPSIDAPSVRANDKVKAAMTPRERAGYARAFSGPPGPEHGVEIELPDGQKFGIVLGGCNGKAMTQLYGDAVEWIRLESSAASLRIAVQQRTRDTGAFKAAVGEWRDCVKERGVVGDTPFDAAVALKEGKTEREIEDGIDAIWECQRAARLIEVAEAEELAVARDETREYEATILAYREKVHATLQIAQDVLAGHK